MASISMSWSAGTSMPISRASVIIAYSFSGTPGNSREGSLMIQDPPTPAGRNGQPAPCRLNGGKLQLHAGQRKA